MPRGNETASGRGGGKGGSRRSAVAALLMIVAAILVMISLVTYDAGDQSHIPIHASDLSGVVTGDQNVRAMADTVHNGLGLVGALMSDFLINSTVGYAVVAFPLLIVLWGWTILRRGKVRTALVITNYTVICALLVSVSFGMITLIVGAGGPAGEWSGIVGLSLATMLSQLIGRTGGSIVLVAGMLLTAVLAADLDVHESVERLRAAFVRFSAWLDQKREEAREAGEKARDGLPPPVPARANEVTITKPAPEDPVSLQPAAPIVRRHDVPPGAAAGDLKISVSRLPRVPVDEPDAGPLEAGPEAGGAPEEIDYVFPSVELLDAPRPGKEDVDDEELKANADLLRATLAEFDVELESVSVTPGPVVTLYELVPASGVKISRIVSLENDMALKLAAKGIRIMAPIPGKSAVGVEIPNSHRSLVTIRSVINSTPFREANALLPLAMGKTISGEVFTDDLGKMPHLLIAGSTGSGKSVGINTILASLLTGSTPRT